MGGKIFKKGLKNKEISKSTLKRSEGFIIGKNEGEIVSLEYIRTKSNKEPLKITIKNKESGAMGEYLIFQETSYGRRLINMLIETIPDNEDIEEISLDEFIGNKVGFETQLNGEFENLIAFYNVQNYKEDDEEEEVLLDDEVLEEIEEEEVLEDDDLEYYEEDNL